MGLIVRRVLKAITASPTGATPIFIWLPKRALSSPYQLTTGAIIEGKILDLEDVSRISTAEDAEIFNQLVGEPIEFALVTRKVGDDALFITADSWPTLRDYGVLPDQFEIEVAINKTRFDTETVEIYPKRDVRID